MNSKITSVCLLGSLLITSQNAEASGYWNPYTKAATLLTAATAATIIGYKLFFAAKKQTAEYLEERIIEEVVKTIKIGLMPRSKLDAEKDGEKVVEILKTKARLINVRKRIIAKLESLLDDPTAPLTQKQKAALKKQLLLQKPFFAAIDLFRRKNAYEKEYATPSVMKEYIEQQIIDSILLMAKPDEECTEYEISQKNLKKERRNKIICRLKGAANQKLADLVLPFCTILAIVAKNNAEITN